MDDYNRGGHTKYSMKAHIIPVTKYRKRLFTDRGMKEDVKQYLYDSAKRAKVGVVKMEADRDHVHILISYSPQMSVSAVVKALKEQSTYYMWKAHNKELKQHFRKRKVLWSDGYFVCSIGQVSQSTIERYIEGQG